MAKIEGAFEKELEVRMPVRLEVKTGSGDVDVLPGEDGRLRVSAEFDVEASSQGQAEELARRIEADPPIEVEGDLVRIGDLSKYSLGRQPLGPFAVFDFSISAPRETQAMLNSGSGDHQVRGLRGPVRVRAGSGDVQIEDIEGDVDVGVGSGDIRIARARLAVSAESGRGDVDLTETTGPVTVKAGCGDVSLRDIGGNIDASVGHGDITLESPVGAGAEWALKAGSGDVELLLPRDSQFRLCAVSVSGDIETDFDLESLGRIGRKKVEGQVGEDKSAGINVTTGHGDITIEAR